MRSHSSPANPRCFFSSSASSSSLKRSSPHSSLLRLSSCPSFHRFRASSCYALKLPFSSVRRHGIQHRICQVRAMDEGFSSFDDWGDEGIVDYMIASSDGEESDGEVMLNPLSDVDLPTSRERFRPTNDAMTMAAHRFGMLRRGHRQSRKTIVPLPSPLGLVYLGRHYFVLTSLCFVSMANGIDFTDGLDGLAAGTAALAFIGMSIAVLPICCDLAVFGASMAGACVGFLSHNRYKASVFMGDTGSLALGGALAAMASCTGMFFPLFISSGIFVLETMSVIMQVSFFKATKYLLGYGRRLFKMAPLHHHLELYGLKEPNIVVGAYILSSIFTLLAGYVGLVSA